MRRKKTDAKRNEATAEERLAELLRSEKTFPYHENIPDKEFSFVKLSIRTGLPELFVIEIHLAIRGIPS